MTLEGKVAIVTGSGRGIGRAIATQLGDLGANVVINDIDSDVAEETAAAIEAPTAVFAGNLLEDDAPDRLVATAVDAFDGVDILVNNAGYTLDAVAHKMTDADFREILELHVVTPFKLTRAVAPYFREPAKAEREEGREVFRKIVNISSLAALGNAGQANYSSAKAGVLGLTRALAKEWGSLKVNVNAVAYGAVETRLTAEKGDDSVIRIGDRQVQVGVPAAARDGLAAAVPLGRMATPAEAAAPVVFLCSPASDYVTGQVLAVAGGLSFGMSL
jgi:3-oxoacyl-[acyl-carrier protein] reductase